MILKIKMKERRKHKDKKQRLGTVGKIKTVAQTAAVLAGMG